MVGQLLMHPEIIKYNRNIFLSSNKMEISESFEIK